MRFLVTIIALALMTAGPAQAMENRITTMDIHNFVQNTNSAINHPNQHVTRSFLNRAAADNAVFVNQVAVYNPGAWQQAWYGHPASGYYYRYPLNPHYSPTSASHLGKWDHIYMLENKKRTIPGYRANMDVTGSRISAYGGTAVVDINLKEYSLAYTPYNPALTDLVMHANSTCRMYLSKVGEDMMMTRMDCNTNTNLPL